MGATTERRLTAFGETRTIEGWARDPRFGVWTGVIQARLEEGWTPEQAIALQQCRSYGYAVFDRAIDIWLEIKILPSAMLVVRSVNLRSNSLFHQNLGQKFADFECHLRSFKD